MKKTEYEKRKLFHHGDENPVMDSDVIVYRTINVDRKISAISLPVLSFAVNWTKTDNINGGALHLGRIHDYVVLDRSSLRFNGLPVKFDGEGLLVL